MMNLDDLDDSQLKQILQHLVSKFDQSSELAITPEEVSERTAEDWDFLHEAGMALKVNTAGEQPSLRTIVETIAEEIPESRPTIEDAAARVRRVGTLPLSDMASDILVVTAAAAILRPKFSFRRTTKDSKVEVTLEAGGGGRGLRTVLETVLQFLRQGS